MNRDGTFSFFLSFFLSLWQSLKEGCRKPVLGVREEYIYLYNSCTVRLPGVRESFVFIYIYSYRYSVITAILFPQSCYYLDRSEGADSVGGPLCGVKDGEPLEWRKQFWQSLEEGAGKRC